MEPGDRRRCKPERTVSAVPDVNYWHRHHPNVRLAPQIDRLIGFQSTAFFQRHKQNNTGQLVREVPADSFRQRSNRSSIVAYNDCVAGAEAPN